MTKSMNLIEKILANHSKYDTVKSGDIVDIEIDARVARDFGGPNVVNNLEENNLSIDDVTKTFFTFDTNPTGSDQKYAVNQHKCRVFARERGFKVFDIDKGIGTHMLIEQGLTYPGSTAVTTDSHANILGAVGAFGQGMGDKDIAVAFNKGKVWFKVPKSVKINLNGKRPDKIFAKDIVLNLLNKFGANQLLGYSIEIYGEEVEKFTLDERITIASMATEMGAIIILFTPNQQIVDYCSAASGKKIEIVKADESADYEQVFDLDLSSFKPMISLPGKPHDTINIIDAKKTKIDSAFIGSCTNGRIEDMREVAEVLKGKRVAPGVVLKIVPTTDKVWRQCLDEGLITIFKDSGALVSNAGCAGCAAGQVGQNGPGEITISTGNRNFPGKQGKGSVYLASPATVAASAIAGCITTFDDIPEEPAIFESTYVEKIIERDIEKNKKSEKPEIIEGRVWYIPEDNIDTDMIFHNRYLAITDINEMGQYTFDNLKGYEDFSKKAKQGDIVVVNKNFGSGSSRQQAVDCFKALGVQAIIAESFGAIYERNAINAAFPIVTASNIDKLELKDGNQVKVNFRTGEINNLSQNKIIKAEPFSDVQLEIYKNDGLF
ncbi:MAG: 3-isopropylmalate dehydratase large subunit [Bacteroidales bacterium]|nr:3-isopropylmalate dehydratase large subunit [Bacteroidales bacterium]MBN2755530.1 3-isopropylmalate dehydratase large subunit [Bacteroidales bacterium]